MPKSRKKQPKQSRQASQFQSRQSSQARQASQSRPFIPSRQASEIPIERTPNYMYNRMLQYSGIDYPGYISSANKFAVIHGRRVPATWIQEHYATEPVKLNFNTPNQPLPLDEFRRQIEENEFRRRQLVNMPLTPYQSDLFDSSWNAYLFWNPSKRPPNYQMPNEETIHRYISYKGPREIDYEFQNPVYQRDKQSIMREKQTLQHDAELFWNPSKRPANYRLPNEYNIFKFDTNYYGPREITYEYQDPYLRQQHANHVRAIQYLTN